MPKYRHAEPTLQKDAAFGIPKVVYLYNEGIKGVDFIRLKNFIHNFFGDIKVNIVKLKNKAVFTSGLIFDFIATKKVFDTFKYAKLKNACHIILTPKLFATYDEPRTCAQVRGEQKKLHIRAAIFGFPSIISTSGIVEGPAKPKEYYLYKQKYTQLGIWDTEEARLKKKFKNRFIDYEDKRMNEVLKGYIAQGLFFYITGEPFCKKKPCRLYNAHWQEDLIYSQIKSGKFCSKHKKILTEIKSAIS